MIRLDSVIAKCCCAASVGALPFVASASTQNIILPKIVTLVVGGDPGGYDTYSRLLARYLGSHLPGNPSFVVQNMPGAGGVRAANYLYQVAPKDGSVIGSGYGGMATGRLFNIPGTAFDPRKFNWLGSMSSDVGLALAWQTARVKSVTDLLKHELIVGGSGPTSANVVFPTVMNKVLGTKFKIIPGYKGGSDIALAMQKGEIEGVGSVYYSSLVTRNPDWLAKHLVNALVLLSLKPDARFNGVPDVVDLAKTPNDRALLELIFAPQDMSRPFMLPPGAPSDIVGVFQTAFDETLRDPAFLAEATREKIELVNPMSGKQVQTLIDGLYASPPEVTAKAAAAAAGALQ